MTYREGKMVNPGKGKSAWKADQNVTTDPGSPNFLDDRMFEAMAEAGAIEERGIDAASRKMKRDSTKPKRRQKGKSDADSDG